MNECDSFLVYLISTKLQHNIHPLFAFQQRMNIRVRLGLA